MAYIMSLFVLLLAIGRALAQTPTLTFIVPSMPADTSPAPTPDVFGSIIDIKSGRTTVQVGCASDLDFMDCLVNPLNITQGPSFWGYEITYTRIRHGKTFSQMQTYKIACHLGDPIGVETCTMVRPDEFDVTAGTYRESVTATTTSIQTDVTLGSFIRNVTITAGAEKLSAASQSSDDKSAASVIIRNIFLVAVISVTAMIDTW